MQMSSVSRPVMSTVAEINSEPARKRTRSILAVAITMSPGRSGRRKVNRWSPCTMRSTDNSKSGSVNNCCHARDEITAANVGGAIGESPRYLGLSSPNAVANSAIFAAYTW